MPYFVEFGQSDTSRGMMPAMQQGPRGRREHHRGSHNGARINRASFQESSWGFQRPRGGYRQDHNAHPSRQAYPAPAPDQYFDERARRQQDSPRVPRQAHDLQMPRQAYSPRASRQAFNPQAPRQPPSPQTPPQFHEPQASPLSQSPMSPFQGFSSQAPRQPYSPQPRHQADNPQAPRQNYSPRAPRQDYPAQSTDQDYDSDPESPGQSHGPRVPSQEHNNLWQELRAFLGQPNDPRRGIPTRTDAPPRAPPSANRTTEELVETARETLQIIPSLLDQAGLGGEARQGFKDTLNTLPRLGPGLCPRYSRPATISVTPEDTLDAAIALSSLAASPDDARAGLRSNPRVAIVNFANRHKPCGGFRAGALAQEEALCYRSSLALSLERADYPLAPQEGVYSPAVLVARHSLASGHGLMAPEVPARNLPVVSVMTVSALWRPRVDMFRVREEGAGIVEKEVFASDRDRNWTKDTMRLALRMAAARGHRVLVLGALGCGVYRNPPGDVAHCWLEVLREDEFSGGWWREIRFAVYDPKGEGNYEIFRHHLEGKRV